MIQIGDNLAAFERSLSDAMLDQLPFAMSRALNDTAEDVKTGLWAEMQRSFDAPTPFTLRGPAILGRATKRRLTSVPGIREVQSEYLDLQVKGGVRRPSGQALLVPFGARLNRYGNMPRGYVRRLLASGRAFVASRSDPRTSHLVPGIYRRRVSRGRVLAPQLLVAFEAEARYEARYDFEGLAERRARAAFPGHLSRRMREAWATRR